MHLSSAERGARVATQVVRAARRRSGGGGTVADRRRDPCPFISRCRLKWALEAAEPVFFLQFDRLTHADVVAGPTTAARRALFRADPGDGGRRLPRPFRAIPLLAIERRVGQRGAAFESVRDEVVSARCGVRSAEVPTPK